MVILRFYFFPWHISKRQLANYGKLISEITLSSHMLHLWTPWKRKKTNTLSVGIEMEHKLRELIRLLKIGLSPLYLANFLTRFFNKLYYFKMKTNKIFCKLALSKICKPVIQAYKNHVKHSNIRDEFILEKPYRFWEKGVTFLIVVHWPVK